MTGSEFADLCSELQAGPAKVENATDIETGGMEIVYQLRLVRGIDDPRGLEFHSQAISDEQISHKLTDNNSFIRNLQRGAGKARTCWHVEIPATSHSDKPLPQILDQSAGALSSPHRQQHEPTRPGLVLHSSPVIWLIWKIWKIWFKRDGSISRCLFHPRTRSSRPPCGGACSRRAFRP